eukprot:3109494-Rhodomonas_salina.1
MEGVAKMQAGLRDDAKQISETMQSRSQRRCKADLRDDLRDAAATHDADDLSNGADIASRAQGGMQQP